ncbi:HlyD family secretion protein [Vibrio sp. SCSIO 43140]|uniref:HlyD family secretion protein n=1 Tax=Vibrio sp. SCSIO 43140 TaxID=2819100 RepID=UPI002074F36D|nr:biotin/lipoyl-binding protein [Vibrio sp. SCSIO 43140]USD63674.1 HlyD family secretion protein [Vibrio sp. SCSIO 43140]
MDMLIILTYTSICIAIFKLFKIPLNKWTVPTAVLGGIAILSTIMIAMNFNHPYAKFSKEYFVSVPIIPEISGTVDEVFVRPNTPVKKGEILYTIKSDKQMSALRRAEAALEEAKTHAYQNEEALLAAKSIADKAEAAVAKAEANRDRTFTTFQRYKDAHTNGGDNSPFTDQDVDRQRELYAAAQAQLDAAVAAFTAAKADERRILLSTTSMINGENTRVAQLLETKHQAQLDFENTIIRAPSDGVATQVALAPGFRVVTLPLRPSMVFVPTSNKRQIAGMFWQNSLQRMKPGLNAEVILDSAPGKVLTGKLVQVLPAMREGEVQANGTLMSARSLAQHGFAIGIIELDRDLNQYSLPLGVQGQAVVINEDNDILHTSIVRRILFRMMAWLKYVWPIK